MFLEDPGIPMDNNRSERTLRGPVISRQRRFGPGGPAGAKPAGHLLSVLQTARVAGLNPYRCPQDWLDAYARNRGQAPSDLSPWLPWEMDEQRMEEPRAPPIRCWTPANGPPAAALAPAPGSTVPRAACPPAEANSRVSLRHSPTFSGWSPNAASEPTLHLRAAPSLPWSSRGPVS